MKRLLLALVLVCASSAFGASQQQAPVVTVDTAKNTVTATGLTRGTQALFFSVGANTNGVDRTLSEWHEIVTDADNDGSVTYTSPRAIPWRSIWVVVDLRSADFGIGSPSGYNIPLSTTQKAFRHDSSGLLNQIASAAPRLTVAYVHPGGGVWLMATNDGQPDDADGTPDGFTTLSLSSFTPLATAGDRPKEFTPGGVLIAVDVFSMQLYAVHLNASVLKGGRQ